MASFHPLALRSVLSNLFDPVGRTRHNHEAVGRTILVSSKVTTKICWTLIYCIWVIIVIFLNPRLSITCVNATFDKFYLTSVTFKYITFSTYKLAIAKYNLNVKLMYHHLFIPLNLWFLLNYCNFEFLLENMYTILNYWHGRELI